MSGEIGILNGGAGDTKLVFDNSNPDETANASRIVKDMIRRGYAIFIEIGRNDKGPIYQRACDFDEKTAEYIVSGPADDKEKPNVKKQAAPARRSRQVKTQRISAAKTNAVAVARTAGG